MKLVVKNEFKQHAEVASNTIKTAENSILKAADLCIKCLNGDGKIILLGNGGSAADAQHIAAELVGRYKTDRKGLPAISLSTDTSIITSISNDFGFEKLFERQVESLAKKNDVLIGISTSGKSENVINALKIAKHLNCKTIGLSGNGGGQFNLLCDVNIIVPSEETPRIQEMHILIGHIICNLIDQAFS